MSDRESPEVATTLLVVSDDEAVRDEARYGFGTAVEVTFAHDSRDAWKVLENLTPSAVVVDMQTGNAGGYALTKDIRQLPRLERLPVLVLLEREHDGWLAKTAGASAYRTKPLRAGELSAEVATLLSAASS